MALRLFSLSFDDAYFRFVFSLLCQRLRYADIAADAEPPPRPLMIQHCRWLPHTMPPDADDAVLRHIR